MLAMLLLALCTASLSPAQTDCAPVETDRLTVADLAAVLPPFRTAPPDPVISAAPAPGARRIFHPSELLSIARRYSVTLADTSDICFEWRLHPLDRTLLLDAMRAALPLPDLRLDIVETSLYPVPPGRIEFRADSLGSPPLSPATPVIWRGNVLYATDRRFSIWARVTVSAKLPRVVAVQPLKRSIPIDASQIRLESADVFPARANFARALDEVIGKAPWRDLPVGAPVILSTLAQPPDVVRGETVDVEVRTGAARLAFTAKAEASGRTGEIVNMRNLTSNRVFTARITGKGHAIVDMELHRAN
jgi:flagella basal body P-ring formation protein FlgA